MTPQTDFPLSPSQERLWFAMQMAPESHAYTIALTWQLTGPLDSAALTGALRYVVQRHDSLRAAFPVTDDGEPLQRISATLPVDLPVTDLRPLPEADRMARAQQEVVRRQREPMDIDNGPLLRAGLIRLDEQCHVLCVEMHHLVFDGWSSSVFERDLSTAYAALVTGTPIDLPPVVQYPTVVTRDAGLREVQQADLAYWREALAGLVRTELPTDRPRPTAPVYHGDCVQTALDETAAAALRRLCRAERVSPYMVMLSIYLMLLRHRLGVDDVSVAAPMSGRVDPDVDDTIGLFTRTLVLRAQVDGDLPFVELLRQVRERVLLAHEHQEVTFADLVTAVGVRRQWHTTPLCAVSFDLDAEVEEPQRWHGLDCTVFRHENTTSVRFDVELFVGVRPDGMRVLLTYATDLFDRPTIEQLAELFTTLAGQVLADPTRRVDAYLPALAEAAGRSRSSGITE